MKNAITGSDCHGAAIREETREDVRGEERAGTRMRLLVWLAPAAAAALALAYIATAPRPAIDPAGNAARDAVPAGEQAAAGASRPGAAESGEPRAEPPAAAARNCTMLTQYLPGESGAPVEVYTCAPLRAAAEHPYERYPSAALASLAYSDAEAARTLGMRLREDDEEAALSLIFRASALAGGDAGPILAFSNAYPRPSSVDGTPVTGTIHRKFVLSAVADLLGAERNNLDYWESRVRETSADPERDIERLRARARTILEEMRQIQLDVTGSASIGGADNA